MNVLHHADKPNLSWLAGNPEISETIENSGKASETARGCWFAATFAASIFHYVGKWSEPVRMRKRIILHEEKTRERK